MSDISGLDDAIAVVLLLLGAFLGVTGELPVFAFETGLIHRAAIHQAVRPIIRG